jgi:regulator of sirC expression with transglutaminase-like and TPR domain
MKFELKQQGSALLELLLEIEQQWTDAGEVQQAKACWFALAPLQAEKKLSMNALARHIDSFYRHAFFTPPIKPLLIEEMHQPTLLCYAINQREADPLVLILLLLCWLQQAGFDCDIVRYKGEYLVQVHLSRLEKVWVDPYTGAWQCLLNPENGLALSLTQELATEVVDFAQFCAGLWQLQKQLLLALGQREQALAVVQHLLEQKPGDPYLHRERGLLSELLDHWSLAISDYQYFVDQKPDDPSNEHMKQQIRQLSSYPQWLH